MDGVEYACAGEGPLQKLSILLNHITLFSTYNVILRAQPHQKELSNSTGWSYLSF